MHCFDKVVGGLWQWMPQWLPARTVRNSLYSRRFSCCSRVEPPFCPTYFHHHSLPVQSVATPQPHGPFREPSMPSPPLHKAAASRLRWWPCLRTPRTPRMVPPSPLTSTSSIAGSGRGTRSSSRSAVAAARGMSPWCYVQGALTRPAPGCPPQSLDLPLGLAPPHHRGCGC